METLGELGKYDEALELRRTLGDPALIGIELKDKADYEPLLERMRAIELNFKVLSSDDMLYQYLI